MTNLKDDGDLRAMKSWKQQMQTYTGYIKKEFDLMPELFYDVFTNLCKPEMKKELDGVKNILRSPLGLKPFNKERITIL